MSVVTVSETTTFAIVVAFELVVDGILLLFIVGAAFCLRFLL